MKNISQSCLRLVACLSVVLLALGSSTPSAFEAKKPAAEESNPLAKPSGHGGLENDILQRQHRIDETMVLGGADDKQIAGTPDFKTFVDSANRAFKPYAEERPRFYAGASGDGKYVYLASSNPVFTTYKHEWDSPDLKVTKSAGRYLIFPVPDEAWSLKEKLASAELFTHRDTSGPGAVYLTDDFRVITKDQKYDAANIDSAHLLKYLQGNLPTLTIYDEQILNIKSLPREILESDGVKVNYSDPPPTFYFAYKLSSKTGPPQWYAKLSGCCFYGARPPVFDTFDTLRKSGINKQKVHLVNFFFNTFAKSTIEELAHLSGTNTVTDAAFFGSNTSQKLNAILSASKDEVVLVAGHVEGEKNDTFVAYDDNGAIVFRVEIKELQQLADKFHVSLILVGCRTVSAVHGDANNIVGTLDEISTRRAMEQLNKALTTAGNWGEFFERLAAPDLVLVASKNIPGFRDPKKPFGLAADILKKSAGSRFEIIGFLRARFQCGFLNSNVKC
ncbi:hypothetical protein [Paraburkholderia youngii]|uniref:CHAT domain-containing protein n=1 Tax=Paraburkholderia youngii TaxID=2782701 RepID=A0A7W8L4Y9_9BURK|nr:hypothetical protein [Paraburkholderia youngii]MBB5400552.1 hypothetical protein [Paraburkholderia youngii]